MPPADSGVSFPGPTSTPEKSVIDGKLKPKEIEDADALPALLTLNASIESGGIVTVEPEGALVQLAGGQTFAPVTVASETCGLMVGGGQVEFVIYESRPGFVVDEEAAAAAGLATEGEKEGDGGNAGSVDQAEQQARESADAVEEKAEEKADQVEQQLR